MAPSHPSPTNVKDALSSEQPAASTVGFYVRLRAFGSRFRFAPHCPISAWIKARPAPQIFPAKLQDCTSNLSAASRYLWFWILPRTAFKNYDVQEWIYIYIHTCRHIYIYMHRDAHPYMYMYTYYVLIAVYNTNPLTAAQKGAHVGAWPGEDQGGVGSRLPLPDDVVLASQAQRSSSSYIESTQHCHLTLYTFMCIYVYIYIYMYMYIFVSRMCTCPYTHIQIHSIHIHRAYVNVDCLLLGSRERSTTERLQKLRLEV